jgi:hypothetical protein
MDNDASIRNGTMNIKSANKRFLYKSIMQGSLVLLSVNIFGIAVLALLLASRVTYWRFGFGALVGGAGCALAIYCCAWLASIASELPYFPDSKDSNGLSKWAFYGLVGASFLAMFGFWTLPTTISNSVYSTGDLYTQDRAWTYERGNFSPDSEPTVEPTPTSSPK